MSIKQHILDDEDVVAHCSTRSWVWVCTDQRILKYRESDRGTESLHDLSFREISAISLTNKPRKSIYLVVSIFCLIGLFGWWYMLSNVDSYDPAVAVVFSGLFVGAGVLFLYIWYNSSKSYFEFRGGGVIQQEPEMWRINWMGADDKDQVQDFVKTVREQLSDQNNLRHERQRPSQV
ncbi:hypothetical protein [Halorubrum trapanicum]|uniref:hypothetical protein n=1 Tax=Halorubrum trapanicum TaxID=29284 RepID=UPI0012FD73B8|nr:hypothetical protein [Halorubrum trapanicum]